MINLPLDGGFYELDSLPISAQQCKNFRVNIPQTQGAWSQANLFGTEGLSQAISSGTIKSANRGSHTKDESPYFLNGETLWRMDRALDALNNETLSLVNMGSIAGVNRASFSDNGTQLMIIVDGEGYITNEDAAPVFQQITDASFKANGVPKQVVFVDSYFVVTTDSKKFIRSDANDGLSWSALNVFSAEADPDDIVAPIVFKGELFIGGSETIEGFQNNAGQFQRTKLIINKGISSPFGVANTSDSFMWIGAGENESPAIWAFTGSSAQKISTTAIDSVLDKLAPEDVGAAIAYSYGKSGAYIVGFTFSERTFEYNTVTQKWNERGSRIKAANGAVVQTRWRANSILTAYNKLYCGDVIDGRIGVLDSKTYSEYGDEIIRTFVTSPFSNQGKSISVPKLEITMESGVGDFDDEPQIRLSTSKDGKKFNNELSRGFGKVGENNRRAVWRSLGRFPRIAVFKFVMSDKVKPVIIKLEGNLRGGRGN